MKGTSGSTGESVYEGRGGRSDRYELFAPVDMDERFAMMIPRSLAKAVIVVHTSESRGESWRVLESGGES